MKLIIVGVNHKTAPVTIREQVAFGDDLGVALNDFQNKLDGNGAVIVSTCNRTEIYAAFDGTDTTDDISPQASAMCRWLCDYKGVSYDDVGAYLYVYEDARALNHWIRVASGLDSMILGEPQILGQIRQAVSISKTQSTITPRFDWLTQQIFASARRIRRDTKVGQQAVSLGYATAKLVTQIFDDPQALTLLIVAAGEMNRLVAQNVSNLGMKRIIIANRSPKRGLALKEELDEMARQAGRSVVVECVPLDTLGDALVHSDVVSSCSGSMHALIDESMVKYAQKQRRHRPMLLVDLAVPRDIEPNVAHLDDVYLYSVDDLQHVIKGNLEERKQAAVEAELLASQLTTEIESQLQLYASYQTISDYRQTAHQHKEHLLSIAKAKLAKGEDTDVVLDELAHRLTQTLTHPPSRLIRHVALNANTGVLEMVADGLDAYRKKDHAS